MLHDPGEIAGIHWKRNDSLNGSDTVCLMQEDSRKESDKKKVCQSSFHLARRKILCKRYSTKVKNGAGKQGGFWHESLEHRKPWRSERYARRNGVNAGLAVVAY